MNIEIFNLEKKSDERGWLAELVKAIQLPKKEFITRLTHLAKLSM